MTLALAEALENHGRFVEDIANGLWNICEESTWTLPAHNSGYLDGEEWHLPDTGESIIALLSADTSSLLATVDGLQLSCAQQLESLDQI